jgi:hypothetical protein
MRQVMLLTRRNNRLRSVMRAQAKAMKEAAQSVNRVAAAVNLAASRKPKR